MTRIFVLALVGLFALTAIAEARHGKLLKRVRHPFGGACSNGSCSR